MATLIRILGDFDLAEEAVQEAFVIAVERWPRDGVPDNPGAWIVRTARNRVRKAARAANLPDWLTLEACRHGGITELADADLTEQGVMAMTGHKTPAVRVYEKRTETQRLNGARKRRAFLLGEE